MLQCHKNCRCRFKNLSIDIHESIPSIDFHIPLSLTEPKYLFLRLNKYLVSKILKFKKRLFINLQKSSWIIPYSIKNSSWNMFHFKVTQIINSWSADRMATGWIYAYLWLVGDPFWGGVLGCPGRVYVPVLCACVSAADQRKIYTIFV